MTDAIRRSLITLAGMLVALVAAAIGTGPANAATTDFVSSWDTTKVTTGSSNSNQVRLPLEATGEYNFVVDWGDSGPTDTITSWNQTEVTHTYANPGVYTVTISFPDPGSKLKGWRFNGDGDKAKILTISQWGGKINLGNNGFYFYGAENLTSSSGSPDLTGTTSLTWMFVGASNFNGDISSWDTSNVTDMSFMLYGAEALNQDIGGWNTSNVTNMSSMLYGTVAFNQDISSWDTSNVTDMSYMFYRAEVFNQDISSWDTSNVTSISNMFNRAYLFNQDIGSWDTSKVTDMTYMFYDARAFDQDVSGWNTAEVAQMLGMFDLAGLSTANYDKLLVVWSDLPSVQAGVSLGAEGIEYSCAAAVARDSLIFDHNWTITDAGEAIGDCFQSTWNTFLTSTGSSNDFQIRLPLESDGVYDFVVDWGDGSSDVITSWNQAEATHTYPFSTVWDIRISGTLKGWSFNNGGDRKKLLDISRWGDLNLGNNGNYFFGAENLVGTATDAPDLTGTTNLTNAFRLAEQLTGGLSAWDTSNVTQMDGMFAQALAFNDDISGWDTGKVTLMDQMFIGTKAFNQDISGWDTGTVSSMSGMFAGADAFNQDIGGWDVSSVTEMSGMFLVTDAFNQNISTWNTSSVTDMSSMFAASSAFNQDLSTWDISQVTDFADVFSDSALSTPNYDAVLIGWSGQAVQADVPFGATNIRYSCAAEAARQSLIDNNGWIITDAGAGPCVSAAPNPIAFASTTVGRTDTQTVTVSNPGGSDLVLPANAITLSGADAARFSLSADTCSGATVAAAGSCTVTVSFSPTATGDQTAELQILSNALTSPNTVPVTGTGVLPGFNVTPEALNFGSVTIRTSGGPKTVTVTNGGPGVLTIAGTSISGAGFRIAADTCSGSTVPAGGTCSVQVRFSPTTKGAVKGQLSFTSNAPGSPHTVDLSGTGTRKKKQTLRAKLPKRIKVSGLTVITPANARTNAGQLVRTIVRGGPIKPTVAGQVRYFTVVRGPQGKTSVRTYGYPNLRLRVSQKAPANAEYTPFARTATYTRGERG